MWDASFGLLEFFANHSNMLCDRVVIELGSGTGLAGKCHLVTMLCPSLPKCYKTYHNINVPKEYLSDFTW